MFHSFRWHGGVSALCPLSAMKSLSSVVHMKTLQDYIWWEIRGNVLAPGTKEKKRQHRQRTGIATRLGIIERDCFGMSLYIVYFRRIRLILSLNKDNDSGIDHWNCIHEKRMFESDTKGEKSFQEADKQLFPVGMKSNPENGLLSVLCGIMKTSSHFSFWASVRADDPLPGTLISYGARDGVQTSTSPNEISFRVQSVVFIDSALCLRHAIQAMLDMEKIALILRQMNL